MPPSPAFLSGAFYNVRDYVPFLAAPITDIPIYLAGGNPRTTELAGSHADGLILGPLRSVAYLKGSVHPNLKKGLGRRDGVRCGLCLTHICSVSDAARARNLARHAIAFYSVLPYYDIVLCAPRRHASPTEEGSVQIDVGLIW
jgi:alkanesulfonate monooxygenase SsuD/methylene tetrahydromethanopterin reductase-like flavin-dependent oxidoreductase (luciferase family)